jgi:hypothetical protein
MPKLVRIGSYGQNQALRAHVWAKNGPKTIGKRSKKLAKQENVTNVANSKRTHNGQKCSFCSSRRT